MAIAGGVVLIVACGGSDDDEPVDSTSPVTIVETTDAPTTTASPPTTEPAESTAPPTTDDPTQALIAEIEADLNEGEQAVFAAGADPANPDLRRRPCSGTSPARRLEVVNGFLDSPRRGRASCCDQAETVDSRLVVIFEIERLEISARSRQSR